MDLSNLIIKSDSNGRKYITGSIIIHPDFHKYVSNHLSWYREKEENWRTAGLIKPYGRVETQAIYFDNQLGIKWKIDNGPYLGATDIDSIRNTIPETSIARNYSEPKYKKPIKKKIDVKKVKRKKISNIILYTILSLIGLFFIFMLSCAFIAAYIGVDEGVGFFGMLFFFPLIIDVLLSAFGFRIAFDLEFLELYFYLFLIMMIILLIAGNVNFIDNGFDRLSRHENITGLMSYIKAVFYHIL